MFGTTGIVYCPWRPNSCRNSSGRNAELYRIVRKPAGSERLTDPSAIATPAPRFSSFRFYPARSRSPAIKNVSPFAGAGGIESFRTT